MKLLLRTLVILLAGIAVAVAFVPLGSTSWAENTRARRSGRGRPPAAILESASLPSAPGGDPTTTRAPAGPARGGRGQTGGRGGRGGNPGLFSHFRGDQSLAADALRFTQIIVIQIAIPAGLTMAVLAVARRKRGTA